ncbi:hypothetical protein J6590_039642 [Homalodisca vitripennis]|nr:hypothetical protein J6590_039642 [Homalodisca vitripennis]
MRGSNNVNEPGLAVRVSITGQLCTINHVTSNKSYHRDRAICHSLGKTGCGSATNC